MLKTLFLSLLIAAHLGGDHVNRYLEKRYPAPPAKEIQEYIKRQNPDGSWPDIRYGDKKRSRWNDGTHLTRFQKLCLDYHYTGSEEALEAARKSLVWWTDRMPQCPNWWFNMISAPRTVGVAILMIRDSMNPDEQERALRIMNQCQFGKTGQNKVWQATNVLLRGLFLDDEGLVRAARDTIASEIRITTKEGLQPDMSFHQHGPQLQFGNYGLAYATSFATLIEAFRGTPIAFSEEQERIIHDYVSDGLRWVVWKGRMDMSACGRQVFKGQQRTKGRAVQNIMRKLGIEDTPLTGARYFPRSDFGVYRTPDWYASVRMQSRRTIGFECTNKENMRANFSADGAVLVRVHGDEYKDVSACWDWHHVPGTTAYDDGPLWGPKGKKPYNKSERVFGKAGEDCLVTAMELDRDGLKARKCWFFTPSGIICLGTDIHMEKELRVTTAVEQNVLQGEVRTGKGWAWHDGKAYVRLDGGRFVLAPYGHKGDWYAIASYYSKDEETKDLFDLYIDHGTAPSGASYAYAVLPVAADGKTAARQIRRRVKVLSNSTELQSLQIDGKTYTVDWERTEIRF